METLLFSKADFKAPYPTLPPSLTADRIEPAMLRAQRRLRPILGSNLYNELSRLVLAEEVAQQAYNLAKQATPAATDAELPALAPLVGPWQELREKVVPGLLYATLAHYLPFSQTTATSHSWVKKTDGNSEPIDGRTLSQQASICDGEALSYEAEMRAWLIANAHDFAAFYPMDSRCATEPARRTPTTVVQAIGHPDDCR